MSLEQWADNGWLKAHQTSVQEIRELFEGAIEDLQNALKDLSAGWKFAIAYNAALRLCSILLSLSGYRAVRNQKHYRSIAVLPLIVGDEIKDLSNYLDRCRVKRGEITYESLSVVSLQEAEELIKAVQELQQIVVRWIEENHPGFIS